MYAYEVGDLLAELCRQKQLTGTEIANRLTALGFPVLPNTVHQWKIRNPPVESFPYLEAALDLTGQEQQQWEVALEYTAVIKGLLKLGFDKGAARKRAQLLFEDGSSSDLELDQVSQLVETLGEKKNALGVYDVLQQLSYKYAYTKPLRDYVKNSENSSQLLDLCADLIILGWDTHKDVIEIAAAPIQTNDDQWNPQRSVFDELKARAEAALDDRDTTLKAVVESLATAFAKKGVTSLHRDYLHASFDTPAWLEADLREVDNYYGDQGQQLSAYRRHYNNPYYAGLLRAHDVSRLLHLLGTTTGKRRAQTFDLLNRNTQVLVEHGEDELVKESVNQINVILKKRRD